MVCGPAVVFGTGAGLVALAGLAERALPVTWLVASVMGYCGHRMMRSRRAGWRR